MKPDVQDHSSLALWAAYRAWRVLPHLEEEHRGTRETAALEGP
jgi:hypothetical protein